MRLPLVLLLLLPLIEIALFVLVGDWLGLWPVLGLVVAGVVLGAVLIRRQGREALQQIQRAANGFGDPLAPVAHGAMLVIAGLLLMLPGFFSDLLALPLLIAPLRRAILRGIAARVTVVGAGPSRPPGWQRAHDIVIEGEAVEIDREARPLPGQGSGGGWTRPPH